MYKKILFPIDINEKRFWKDSFPKFLELCNNFKDSTFVITTIVPTSLGVMEEFFPKGWTKEVLIKSKQKLEEIIVKNVPSDIKFEIIVEKGVVYQAIIDLATKIEADLIVLAAHHPDRGDYLLGPNAAKVVRHSDISVLILR
jgi:nucleotide-binding universal stress UspA family protein